MARTTIVTQSNCKFEQAENIINNILSKNGFKQTTINSGENVWKKGTGFLTAMQFIKIDFSSNEFTISAWVQAGLGSVGGNEMDLTGVVAAIPKKQSFNKLIPYFILIVTYTILIKLVHYL